MKKIGILTFHRSVNCGAFIQAYSLAKRLKEEYPNADVEIIDYHMPIVANSYTYTFSSYIAANNNIGRIKRIIRLAQHPTVIQKLNNRTKIFTECQKMLPLSGKTIFSNSTDEVFDYINSTYDVVIVGSDAVWNYASRGFPNAYFLNDKVHCKKLSYAASCYGMDYSTCPDKDIQQMSRFLSNFNFIGVRDEATENMVKYINPELTPAHTCDPTCFLKVNDLPVNEKKLREKLHKRGFDFNKTTIGMMGSEKMCNMLRRMYGKCYQIVSLYEPVRNSDVDLYDLTPFEWAYVFRFFKVTFTTYFHGTMLSLRNGIPVICLALQTNFAKKYTPKTLDLLKRLSYESWYFKTDYKTVHLDKIKSLADKMLQTEMHDEIVQRLDQEAANFDVFNDNLRRIMEEN